MADKCKNCGHWLREVGKGLVHTNYVIYKGSLKSHKKCCDCINPEKNGS